MAVLDRAALEAFFQTGLVPTQGQYQSLIESLLNLIDDYDNMPALVQSESMGVPSADVLTGFSSPVPFISAPGAGFFTSIVSMQVEYLFNTTGYASNFNVGIKNPSGVFAIKQVNSILAATASLVWNDNAVSGRFPNDAQIIENEAADIVVLNGNPTLGDSDIVVHAQVLTVPI